MRKWVALGAVAAFAYVYVNNQGDALSALGAQAGNTSSHVHGGTLGCSGLEDLWKASGGTPGAAFTAAEIAMAESSGQQYATMHNTNGTTDRGYFQVNSIWGALSTYDAMGNARAAVQISHNGTDWSPWVTFNNGMYQGKC
jgi:Lysozyme like domain